MLLLPFIEARAGFQKSRRTVYCPLGKVEEVLNDEEAGGLE
jgi:hypothetical protein